MDFNSKVSIVPSRKTPAVLPVKSRTTSRCQIPQSLFITILVVIAIVKRKEKWGKNYYNWKTEGKIIIFYYYDCIHKKPNDSTEWHLANSKITQKHELVQNMLNLGTSYIKTVTIYKMLWNKRSQPQ